MNSQFWQSDEIERFEWALNQYGNVFKKITEHVRTRSYKAIKDRFRKHVKDKSEYKTKAWTDDEKETLLEAVREFGDDRKKISESIGSKSVR